MLDMEEKMSNINCYNQEWTYTTKTVNFNNFTINYVTKGGFKSEEEALLQQEADNKQYEIDIKKIKKLTNIKYTFTEFVDFWLSDMFLPLHQTATRAFTVYAIENIIKPNIMFDILLPYVTADYINDIIDRCIPMCKTAGISSIKALRSILRDAYFNGYIKKDLRPELRKIKDDQPKLELLNHDELRKLLGEAKKHPSGYFEILLGVFVGLRSGEIRALKYEDFDEENCTIKIRRQYTNNYSISRSDNHYVYNRYGEEKEPKSNSSRTLKVPEFIFDEYQNRRAFNETILENCKKKGKKKLDKDYVCISTNGTIKGPSTLSASLDRICKYACIPHTRFHALRHIFATLLLEQGVAIEDISKLLGHNSSLTTFNYYCGIIQENEKVQQALENTCPVEGV